MPEGHTIHRLARLHGERFAGSPVRAWSPQGRFAAGAGEIDGRVLLETAAHGKHLFYRFDDERLLYVHLGLIGKFRTFGPDAPDPTHTTRLALANDRATAYLIGPMSCRLVVAGEADEIVGALGPDPLRRGRRGAAEFAARLRRRRLPVGVALLDQRVVAGIGNVYRAEILFLEGIHPETPANTVDEESAARLWETTVVQLRLGLRSGRIVTVDPREVGAHRRSQLTKDERLYVYHRDGLPCRRCGTPIRRTEMGGRAIWWCPTDQPR
jgi:endonuclease-8